METQALTSATTCLRMLNDILKWKKDIPTHQPSVASVPTDGSGVRATNKDTLPFGLGQVIDTTWSDGPRGTTTPEGVDKWLRFWNPWLSYWTGQPSIYRSEPGPWLRKQLEENPVFQTLADWDEDDQAAWQEFTTELRTMWWQIARMTGHAPLTRGLCPTCKRGYLRSPAEYKRGYSDKATCSNPHCGVEMSYKAGEIENARRAVLRDPDLDPNVWVDLDELRGVWPRFDTSRGRKRLNQWVHRGRVTCHQGRYRLADINTLMFADPTNAQ